MNSDPSQAELAIRALEARYCDAVNRRDAEAWSATWAQDSQWTLLGRTINGRAGIRAAWQTAMDSYPMVFHMPVTGLVTLRGEHALCRWYIHEFVRDQKGNALQFMGVYNDTCVPYGDAWVFKSRRFDIIYYGPGTLTADGWKGYPSDLNHAL